MLYSDRTRCTFGVAVVALIAGFGAGMLAQGGGGPAMLIKSAMNNPYRMVEKWAQLGEIKAGPAIGIIPDGTGGIWLSQRADPPILHLDASGRVVKTFGDGMFLASHGFCQDRDGNLWAGDAAYREDPESAGKKGFVMYKFSPDGKLLLTLGKPGVSRAGPDTFIGPTACVAAPNGDIIIADGHWPRPSYAQQDGDRIVRYTKEGKFVREWGKLGSNPGEFFGPHALAFDSQGRLFVADRSNNRLQIFDKDMNFIDDWRHFGRPSGLWINKDDTLFVADSESSYAGFRPRELGPHPPGEALRSNPGWQQGIRIGSAKDGSLKHFISGTRPEGLAADESGNIYGGLTGQCTADCLQKWVMK